MNVVIILATMLLALLDTPASAAAIPNVLIFVMDDVGYGDLGPYGGPIKTPAIGRLAREGMRFTDFHSTPACTPTRASLLTGRYNNRMAGGAVDEALKHNSRDGLPAAEVTIAEMLEGTHPTRAIAGKWHLGQLPKFNPVTQGFTFFYGMLEPDATYTTHIPQPARRDWWINLAPNPVNEYTTFATTREVLRQIDAAGDDPFFIYVPYQAAHWPISLPGSSEEHNLAARPAAIKLVDDSIGQIMERVRTLPRETFVLFISDNGAPGGGGEIHRCEGVKSPCTRAA